MSETLLATLKSGADFSDNSQHDDDDFSGSEYGFDTFDVELAFQDYQVGKGYVRYLVTKEVSKSRPMLSAMEFDAHVELRLIALPYREAFAALNERFDRISSMSLTSQVVSDYEAFMCAAGSIQRAGDGAEKQFLEWCCRHTEGELDVESAQKELNSMKIRDGEFIIADKSLTDLESYRAAYENFVRTKLSSVEEDGEVPVMTAEVLRDQRNPHRVKIVYRGSCYRGSGRTGYEAELKAIQDFCCHNNITPR